MNVEDQAQHPLNHHPPAQPVPLPSPIRNELLMQHMQNMQNLMNPAAFADLAYTYFGRPPFTSQLYPPHPSLPLFYPPPKAEPITPPPMSPAATVANNDQIDVTTVGDRSVSDEEESSSSSSDKTPKKKNFSISSILER